MENELWESDEFEDLVSRGIIALYEDKHPDWKKLGKRVMISDNELDKLKKIGLYFPPGDRYISTHIDVKNDGLPAYGVLSGKHTQENEEKMDVIGGYLHSTWCVKWKNNILPKGWACAGNGLVYALYSIVAREEGGLKGLRRFVKINRNTGVISPCSQPYIYWDGVQYKETYTEKDDDQVLENDIIRAAAALGFWSDKKHLWNVSTAEDKSKKVLFGVYEEQIQSLFYARDLPMTVTGRKRPILHWVAAHKRRLKQGTSVDVRKHMRGITSFEMNGTFFKITQPIKTVQKDA